jgi:AcrR family transcriptional regulator
MKRSSTKKPRLNQRRRTRAALVAAAAEAVRRGQTPTVAEAAEAAGVSRATAYRYFGSQDALLLELSLDLIGNAPTEGPVSSRVDAVIREFTRMSYRNESLVRTFMKLAMEQWLRTHNEGTGDYPIRKGRRVSWFEKALEPLRSLSPRKRRRLMVALSMFAGIEPMIVAKDIYGCTEKEAEDTLSWAAQAILRSAIRDS